MRSALRRGSFWIVLAFVALVSVIAGMIINGASGVVGGALEADNAAPGGGMAVAEVLAQRGVDVRITSSLDDVQSALAQPENSTLLLFDRDMLLTDEQLAEAGDLADDLVLISPGFETLAQLAPGVLLAGPADAAGALEAECATGEGGGLGRAAVNADSIAAEGTDTYRVDTDALPQGVDASACFPGGNGSYAVVETTEEDGATTTVLDGDPLLSNDGVLAYGNAALALTVLGANETLVWYIPTLADVAVTGPPSLAELTPGWVTPVLVLLLVVTIAAALWRGRRFGPLVVENLPVTVRASETVEGRARLYERSSARGRALDALRVGAVSRIASALRLARTASVEEVIAATAATTGLDPAAVRDVLVGKMPGSDRELVQLSDRLGTLEASVASAVDPTGRGNT